MSVTGDSGSPRVVDKIGEENGGKVDKEKHLSKLYETAKALAGGVGFGLRNFGSKIRKISRLGLVLRRKM